MSQLPTLPSPPPTDPLPLAARWLDEAVAGAVQPNPNAMTLATVASNAQPSARVVLIKDFSTQGGYLVFYTHYGSRKGHELAANPRAAAVIHWDTLGRQLRIEGVVVRSPSAESDTYFAERSPVSQFNAWASDQSQPITDRAALVAQAGERAAKLGMTISDAELFDATSASGLQRPEHWGGFRLWISALEFWVQGDGRFHDRIRYERELSVDQPTPSGGPWSAARLQP